MHAWYAYYQHSQILVSLLARDFKAGSTSEDENGTLSGPYTALPDDLAAGQGPFLPGWHPIDESALHLIKGEPDALNHVVYWSVALPESDYS
ncbi:hypothetical protein KSD_60120 [Ktedonobacter sp. SOSP1-85]|nr:hypothetical protein KSD_60120 [Ktedonobacter sp. SOSP1-85]